MRDSIILTLKIALLYVIAAQLAFLLASTQHSPVALFWPPSGIALAAILLRGHLALPGIFIGALATNILLMADAPSWSFFGAGVVMSLSTSLAAFTAGVLLRRFASSAPIWSSAADLLNGSLAVGVACLIPAVLGAGSLYGAGQLPLDAAGLTAGMWWLGDFCGMVVFTPMAFAIARRMKGNFWRPVRPEVFAGPTALNCFIALIALVAFIALWNLEGSAISRSLQREAAMSANAITQALRQAGRDIDSIRSLISASSDHLSEDGFNRYATALFASKRSHPATHGVSWAPRVTSPTNWETRMLKTGSPPSVRMFEQDKSGRKVPVGKRDNYFPLQYIYSLNPARKTLIGFDIGSEQVRRENVEKARDTGRISMAGPIILPQGEMGEQLSMQICMPVYQKDSLSTSLEERRANFTGIACGVYLVSVLADSALAGNLPNIDLHLFGNSGTWVNQLFHSRLSQASMDEVQVSRGALLEDFMVDFQGAVEISFAGQQWLVIARPGPGFVGSMRSWIPWGALILILTLGIVGSSILIERAAAQRRVDAERRSTEQALQNARAANEAKAYFMAAASHDIKQPLYALGILTDTLLMTNPPASTKPVIESLKQSIREMSRHFDTLMDMRKFQDGKFEVASSTIHLGELARRIALEIGPMCRAKGLQWVIEFGDAKVSTDAELLLRLIRNLLINAVRYTDAGEVSCIAKQEGDFVEFRISDSGQGLFTEQQQLFLDEVIELREEESHRPHLGLGLSIVNRISRALNLRINIDSKPGQGTTLTFRFPAAESH